MNPSDARRVRALGAAVLLLSGCSHYSGLKDLPAPPSLPPVPTTTTLPDLSAVGLPSVAGRTTTTIALVGGGATLGGTVVGPDGPVGGATVHIERLVGDATAAADIATNQDGTWTAPGIFGGRYRVRAFRPPDLALTTAQVFYLANDENRQLSLGLDRFTGQAVRAAIAPSPPIIDSPANLVVAVTEQSVDDKGVVRGTPVVGAFVQLSVAGDWTLSTAAVNLTDAKGQVRYQLTCHTLGTSGLSVDVSTDTFVIPNTRLDVAGCSLPPPTTTLPPPTTDVPATTTTLLPTPTTKKK